MASVTLAELRVSVYGLLENNTRFYPQAEVDRAINEQVTVANLFTGLYQSSVIISTQANRFFYAVPAPMVAPLAVSIGGKRLNLCTLAALASRERSWIRHTTATRGPIMSWIPLGIRRLGIYPADAVGGKTLLVEGIIDPPGLVNGTDTLRTTDEIMDGIVVMSAHVLQLKDGGKVFADTATAYQGFLRQMKLSEAWRNLRHPRWFIEKEQAGAKQ